MMTSHPETHHSRTDAPELARDAADRAGRRRRMFIMPVVILLVAGVTWWWGKLATDQQDVALFDATTALVQGHLQHIATPQTPMRLRWADPAMESIFIAGIADIAQVTSTPEIRVRSDLIEADNEVPVEISAGRASIVLLVQPTNDLDIGVIRSVARGE